MQVEFDSTVGAGVTEIELRKKEEKAFQIRMTCYLQI
jgi:hypothetical protein